MISAVALLSYNVDAASKIRAALPDVGDTGMAMAAPAVQNVQEAKQSSALDTAKRNQTTPATCDEPTQEMQAPRVEQSGGNLEEAKRMPAPRRAIQQPMKWEWPQPRWGAKPSSGCYTRTSTPSTSRDALRRLQVSRPSKTGHLSGVTDKEFTGDWSALLMLQDWDNSVQTWN